MDGVNFNEATVTINLLVNLINAFQHIRRRKSTGSFSISAGAPFEHLVHQIVHLGHCGRTISGHSRYFNTNENS